MIVTWGQLGIHRKPIGCAERGGHPNEPLVALLEHGGGRRHSWGDGGEKLVLVENDAVPGCSTGWRATLPVRPGVWVTSEQA